MFTSTIKKTLFASLLTVSAALVSSAQASTILGTGTLNSTNDLTLIQNGATTYDFLDLSATTGESVSAALATYGVQGFHVADSSEISALFDAFGFTYANNGSLTTLSVTTAQAANFTSYLGTTTGNAALGTLNDLTYGFVYSCISTGTCGPQDFVEDANLSSGNPEVGIYLVRSDVPEPTTIALLGLGLFGFAAARRRKQ